MQKNFNLQMFSPPTPPDGDGGGSPPGGGDSSSSSVTWSGATEITSAGTYSKKTYTSTTSDENAVLVNTSGNVKITNSTVTKSGGPTSAGDNYSFYGINSGVMCKGGGNTTISGGTVTTSANGANGIFSYGGNGGTNGAAGDGTTVVISNVTIKTTGDGSGGIMTTGGGITKASNLTVTTTGQSSAPIRTDRGGGNVTVTGGSYTSSGLGSPAIYSTAEVVVTDAELVSNKSEGICIEGQNSVALTNCTLTANNTSTNGQAQFLDAVNIYQSMSGDSSEGTSTFTMTGGTINNNSGHVFHVTNTTAVINLNNVTINNSDSDNVLLSVCDDGWSGASNIATVNITGQTLSGNILVGDDSTLNLNISDSSTFTGNLSGVISNAAGTSISTSIGTANVTLDSTSKWYLTSDIDIASFTGTAKNIITNGYNITVNGTALDGTTDSDDSDITGVTVTGGVVKIDDNFTDDEIDLSDYSSTVTKVNALKRTKSIEIVGNKYANSLKGGSGADIIIGNAGADTIIGGKGADSLSGGTGNDYLTGGYGNDSIIGGKGKDTLIGGYGNDYLSGGNGNDSILGGKGKDTLIGGYGNDTLTGGAGADVFIYKKSTGKDVITDYVAGTDKISISGSYTGKVSDDDVILTSGTGTLTIKNAAGKNLTINNKTRTYSANVAEIDDILEDNFAVAEIEYNPAEIKQENLITYTDK